jgi:hypothetical protein
MDITVTPKQLEILILLYRFRFLNRLQLQTLLHHKDTKRINTWLKDLTNKTIIGRHYSTKLLENTKPAIYYLMTKSKTLLMGQSNIDNKLLLKRIYREKIRSQKLIDHCILLADFYLDQLKLVKENEELHFFTKTDLSTYYYLPYNRPDAYIAQKIRKNTKRYFLEIIDEGTPRFMIRKKIEQYIEYYDAKTWQERTGHPFPTILFLCPNEIIKEFLHKHLAQVMEEEAGADIDFYLATKEKMEWVNALEETETTPEN